MKSPCHIMFKHICDFLKFYRTFSCVCYRYTKKCITSLGKPKKFKVIGQKVSQCSPINFEKNF